MVSVFFVRNDLKMQLPISKSMFISTENRFLYEKQLNLKDAQVTTGPRGCLLLTWLKEGSGGPIQLIKSK